MKLSLNTIMSFLFDVVAPPRRTERIARSLTLNDLLACATEEGALAYRDPLVRALVWELKYHADSHAATLAGEYISDALLDIAAGELGKPLLIPIPMHPARRRERGYNQTEVLCESAFKSPNGKNVEEAFEYAPKVLERVRHTSPQQGLAKHKRLRNVQKAMQVVDDKAVRGRVCVVVDDVSTTGATFAEATRCLLASGASQVHCLALAH